MKGTLCSVQSLDRLGCQRGEGGGMRDDSTGTLEYEAKKKKKEKRKIMTKSRLTKKQKQSTVSQ